MDLKFGIRFPKTGIREPKFGKSYNFRKFVQSSNTRSQCCYVLFIKYHWDLESLGVFYISREYTRYNQNIHTSINPVYSRYIAGILSCRQNSVCFVYTSICLVYTCHIPCIYHHLSSQICMNKVCTMDRGLT
jgi:hypothetical protein